MNDSGMSFALSDSNLSEDPSALCRLSGPDLVSDDDIDYRAIAINTRPGQPGGRIVFSTADYATEEEAMAAMETLFMSDMEDSDESAPKA